MKTRIRTSMVIVKIKSQFRRSWCTVGSISYKFWKQRCFVLMEKLQDGGNFTFIVSLRCSKPAIELVLLHITIHAFTLSTTSAACYSGPSIILGTRDHQMGKNPLPQELQAREEASKRQITRWGNQSDAWVPRHKAPPGPRRYLGTQHTLPRDTWPSLGHLERGGLTLPWLSFHPFKSVPKAISSHFQILKIVIYKRQKLY